MGEEKLIKNDDYWQAPKAIIPVISSIYSLTVTPSDPDIFIGNLKKAISEVDKAAQFLDNRPPPIETVVEKWRCPFSLKSDKAGFFLKYWTRRFPRFCRLTEELVMINRYDDWWHGRIREGEMPNGFNFPSYYNSVFYHDTMILLSELVQGVCLYDSEARELFDKVRDELAEYSVEMKLYVHPVGKLAARFHAVPGGKQQKNSAIPNKESCCT